MRTILLSVLTLTIILPMVGFGQVNWIRIDSTDTGKPPYYLLGSGSSELIITPTGGTTNQSLLVKQRLPHSTWSTISTSALGSGGMIQDYNTAVFQYQGTEVFAYQSGDSKIHFTQWDNSANMFVENTGIPPVSDTSSFSFRVEINPSNGDVYIVSEEGGKIWMVKYDGISWSTVLSNYQSNSTYSNDPYIHFYQDTLYFSVRESGYVRLYKQKVANFNAGNLINVSTNSMMQNTYSSYSMDGEIGQPPYLVNYNTTNYYIVLSQLSGNAVALIDTFDVGAFAMYGEVQMDIDDSGFPHIVFAGDDGNGSGDLFALKWDGTNLIQIGGVINSYITGDLPLRPNITATGGDTSSQLFNHTFVHTSMGYTGSYSLVYVSNQKPFIQSGGVPSATICANASEAVVFPALRINDYDKESFYIKAINSSNPQILPQGKSNYTIIEDYTYNALDGSVVYQISAPINIAGSTILEIIYTDGYESDTLTTTVTVHQPPSATITTSNADCNQFNGTASITTTPGDGSITAITWSTGDIDSTTVTQLSPGQYVAFVEDANGCVYTATANIELNGLNVIEDVDNVTCSGSASGSIQVNVTGSDAPYTYLWSNGKSTSFINDLVAGDYQVTITSASGCQSVKTYTVSSPISPIAINASSPYPPDCNDTNGQLQVNPSGGVSPYTVLWSTGETTQLINNLSAGVYHVEVTDAFGCSAEQDVELSDWNMPTIYAANIEKSSCGLSNGYIDARLSDTSAFGSVLWSNGTTTMLNNNIGSGDFICTVTTNAGCKVVKTWSLEAQKPLQNNICMITVDSATNTNLIVWEKVQTNMDHYNIYRETSVAGEFMLIDTVSALNISLFNDVVASPSVRSWRYKISAVNQCGVEGPLSVPHKTVHLVISQALGNQYNISWNKYQGFEYNTVKLWRYTNAMGWELIDSLPSNIFSYTDNVSGSTAGLDYVLEITPPAPCTANKAQNYNSSRSNKANGLMVPGHGTGASNNGIAEYESDLALTMYPNPTTGKLFLIWEGAKTDYIITDMQGKLIQDGKLNQGTSVVDLSFVETGMYFIQINGKTKKIVVR